ncbi:hypothetical protein AOQ84DRAFT_391328 [Glonium stellatum]|uniref:Uncharacterized protein n=1 Tax=Glonium stellatum TaxID=574774 RepID=A0A8E2JPY3_9PEZI|nr:hypothetical protein AOQ84DRAFT_391328 [Glonium stellatum]
MSALRRSISVRSNLLRPFLRSAPRITSQATPRRFASQDYGSGEGNPAGEQPQKQGANPSADKEHPGPPPPKVGQGSGTTPTKGSSEGHNTGQSQQSPSSGERNKSSSKKGKKGAQPKILSDNPPNEDDPSVREHNKEMENRAERAHEQVSNADAVKDKVSPGYWSGQGGKDRQP